MKGMKQGWRELKMAEDRDEDNGKDDGCIARGSGVWSVALPGEWSVERGVWSVWSVECVECGVCGVRSVWSVECVECGVCGVWSVWSVECVERGVCGVWSVWSVECVECGVCGVWSVWSVECVEFGVWIVVCGVWSVECRVWSVEWRIGSVTRILSLNLWYYLDTVQSLVLRFLVIITVFIVGTHSVFAACLAHVLCSISTFYFFIAFFCF